MASRGAGIGTHDALLEIMRRVGIDIDASIGIQPLSRTCFASDGSVLHEISRPRILSSWGRLYRAPKDALPDSSYHFDKSLVALEQDATAIIATFADGSAATGDLLVGAVGLRSTVRTLLMPEVEPRYAGYVAWRGTIDESAMPIDLHRAIFERNGMCLPQGEILSAYPVPGPDNAQRLFGTRVVARGRLIGAHLEAQLSKPRELRTPQELHQDPQWVMRESARRLQEIPELVDAVRAARSGRAQASVVRG